MADQYAVNHKKRHVTVPAKLTDVADQGGRMRVLYDKFTFSAGVSLVHTGTAHTISFGKLPPGAKVWDASLHQSATLAGSTTLALGITGTPAAFLVAAATTAVGTRHMREGVANITLAPVTITTETTVIATIGGATSTTTTAFVEVRILYTVD
jgi:hypothetical protein